MGGRECVPIAIKLSDGTWNIHLLWIDENSDMHDENANISIPNTVTWITYTRTDVLYG